MEERPDVPCAGLEKIPDVPEFLKTVLLKVRPCVFPIEMALPLLKRVPDMSTVPNLPFCVLLLYRVLPDTALISVPEPAFLYMVADTPAGRGAVLAASMRPATPTVPADVLPAVVAAYPLSALATADTAVFPLIRVPCGRVPLSPETAELREVSPPAIIAVPLLPELMPGLVRWSLFP